MLYFIWHNYVGYGKEREEKLNLYTQRKKFDALTLLHPPPSPFSRYVPRAEKRKPLFSCNLTSIAGTKQPFRCRNPPQETGSCVCWLLSFSVLHSTLLPPAHRRVQTQKPWLEVERLRGRRGWERIKVLSE